MTKHLLVAIADKGYIDQVKQLFSSVYWNAGWKGDYMLMAYEIPESDLEWFRKKGILIRKCGPLHNGAASGIEYPPINQALSEDEILHMKRYKSLLMLLNKFELFTPEFKRWDTVLYLDCDIIVRYSLEKLTEVRGFWAASEYPGHLIKSELHPASPDDLSFKDLQTEFDLNSPAFNSGVMAFSTDIIKDSSLTALFGLFKKYHKNCNLYGEQPIINLYFYKKWRRLNFSYNLCIPIWGGSREKTDVLDAIVMHIFGHDKPWLSKSPFYDEWMTSLQKADMIDLDNRVKGKGALGIARMIGNSYFVKVAIRRAMRLSSFPFLNRCAGLIGIFLKRYFPKIYVILKGRD